MPKLRATKKISRPEYNQKGITVLHLSAHIPWRGGEQQLAYLMEELDKQEDFQQVVVCAKESGLEKYCIETNIDFISFPKRSAFDLIFARELSRVCKRVQPDLIHIHDSHAHTFAVIAATMYRNRIPLVLSRKVDFKIRSGRFSKFKYNHPLIKRIICVSNAIKEIIAHDIKSKEVLDVVYDGVDIKKFSGDRGGHFLRSKYKVRDDEILIGNVAAIAPHKDYFTFVDTVDKLVAEGVKAMFFIIGDGPEKNEVKDYIRYLNLEAHIIMTGFLDNITEVLPELDILLFTSKTEGLGTSILDAYGAEVNVVATRAGGIPEIVDHGVTGLLADVQDPEALASNVRKLINDKDLAELLRVQALEKLRQFSKERMAKSTMEIYKEVKKGEALFS